MGHTWREMDPAGAAASDRRSDRIDALKKSLKSRPLSEFVAEDVPLLNLLFSRMSSHDLWDSEIDYLETL